MKLKNCLVGCAIGFINGFFASGGGIIAVLALKKILKLEDKKAHATALLIILPLTIMGIFIYSKHGFSDYSLIFKASVGGVIGSFLGAKLLSKLSTEYIKAIFGIVMIFSACKMFFS